jgi:hypothetical protein
MAITRRKPDPDGITRAGIAGTASRHPSRKPLDVGAAAKAATVRRVLQPRPPDDRPLWIKPKQPRQRLPISIPQLGSGDRAAQGPRHHLAHHRAPRQVEPDHGVRTSIEARVLRHGGTAAVRSSVGEGTEVELHMSMRGAAGP